ncbi:probable ATP-dependent RNA helicase DDX52 [Anopheles maculipalpis]|uniref:probable ATP-dependent RNA helicase DDX52 n=1 Tax=Anopheles maculipalpis TaxID=1496333 RepID=UPI0021594494|nr:probable ATP-dependent RNA helicase DDX52 [Anopheles maculipalpis]
MRGEIQIPEKNNQNNTGSCGDSRRIIKRNLEPSQSPNMIANDLFRKLSCGAKFTRKNKLPIKRKLENGDTAVAPKVKLCLKAETYDDDDDPGVTHSVDSKNVEHVAKDNEIKSEPESDAAEDEQQRNQKNKGSKKKTMDATKIDQQNVSRLNKLRKEFKIHVKKSRYSPEVPNIIETFDQLSTHFGVTSRLVSNIAACYSTPAPVQMQAIPVLMKSISLHAYAPTGSGKTAAFLIPILHHLKKPMKCGFRALIICPTRELAKQIQREALRLGDEMNLRTHVIQTVDDPKQSDYSFSSGRSYDILVTTPNRICYLLSQNPPKIDLSNIQWVVIDEADKLFEDSKNSFREQLDTVITACNNPAKTVALFSATQTREVNEWVARNIPSRIRFSVGLANGAVELVEQKLLFTGSESGKLLAFRELVAQGLHPPVLVFVQSKDRAQQLFTELIYDGLNVDVIHSDRTQRERDNVVRAFREGKIWILICTELMSRGIDFKGVNLVVNYDFPPSTISYVHRIGRTGRAGRPGKAVTFFTKDDTVNLKSIAHLIKSAGGEVPEYMLQLHGSSKKARENVARKAPKRAAIRTLPTFEFQQLQRKKRFVSKSKGKTKTSTIDKNVQSKMIVKRSAPPKQRRSDK